MATQLQNSVFIHIPKTGGRWINQQLKASVKGFAPIGDPVYDAHESPETDLPVFAFVRHPITMLNSLWFHRSRKHGNTRHKDWNWQQDIELERVCGCPDYAEFFQRVADNPGIVERYYNHFIGAYSSTLIGCTEHIATDLIFILSEYGEEFNADAIRAAADKKVGKACTALPIQDAPELVYRIVQNELNFCSCFGYTAKEIIGG